MTTERAHLQVVPDIPEGHVIPPNGTLFANATWMEVGPEIDAVLADVLAFDEFRELSGMPFMAVWRRRTKPSRNGEPVLVSAEIVKPLVIWSAEQHNLESFPRYWLHLHWQHFDDLRAESLFVHRDTLAREAHRALMGLEVDNDILSATQPDFSGYLKTVERYGPQGEGLSALAAQL